MSSCSKTATGVPVAVKTYYHPSSATLVLSRSNLRSFGFYQVVSRKCALVFQINNTHWTSRLWPLCNPSLWNLYLKFFFSCALELFSTRLTHSFTPSPRSLLNRLWRSWLTYYTSTLYNTFWDLYISGVLCTTEIRVIALCMSHQFGIGKPQGTLCFEPLQGLAKNKLYINMSSQKSSRLYSYPSKTIFHVQPRTKELIDPSEMGSANPKQRRKFH